MSQHHAGYPQAKRSLDLPISPLAKRSRGHDRRHQALHPQASQTTNSERCPSQRLRQSRCHGLVSGSGGTKGSMCPYSEAVERGGLLAMSMVRLSMPCLPAALPCESSVAGDPIRGRSLTALLVELVSIHDPYDRRAGLGPARGR